MELNKEPRDDSHGSSEGAESPIDWTNDPDFLLKSFLDIMEANEFSMDLTLIVQGTLVSGTPIFVPEYLEQPGNLIDNASHRTAARAHDEVAAGNIRRLGEVLRREYARQGERLRVPQAAEGDENAASAREDAIQEIMFSSREHIMLKNTTIFSPSGEQVSANLARAIRFGWGLEPRTG